MRGQGVVRRHAHGVAQWLKVAHALDRLRDRLLIENAAGLKPNRKIKAISQHPLHDLELHGAHQLQMNLLKMRIPAYAEHGIFVRQLSQCFEHRVDIVFARKHRVATLSRMVADPNITNVRVI